MGINLQTIVESTWGRGRRAGKAVQYRSRWRNDHHPSFAVYENGYHDFATGDHGDVLDFIRREFGLDDRAAAAAWLIAHGHDLPTFQPRQAVDDRAESDAPPSADWQRAALAFVERAQAFLWSGHDDARKALDYLRGRGLTDDTIHAAGLGFNPRSVRVELTPGEVVSIAAGVILPIIIDNVVWAVKVNTFGAQGLAAAFNRQLDERIAKYVYVRGSKTGAPYLSSGALADDLPIFVVEGEYDALIASQQLAGLALAMTVGSASNSIARRWRDLLRGRTIWITPDGDRAGRGGAERLAVQLPGATIAPLPGGVKDVNEYYLIGGDLHAWFIDVTTPRLDAATDLSVGGDHADQAVPRAVGGFVHTGGAPDSWISTMFNLPGGGKNAALAYYLANESARRGQLDPVGFTVADVIGAAAELWGDLDPQIIRRGIALLVKIELFSKMTTKENSPLPVTFENNSVRGPKSAVYTLRSLADQRANLLRAALPGVNESAHPTIDEVPEDQARIADMTERALTDAGVSAANAQQVKRTYNRLAMSAKTAADRRSWGRAQHERVRLEAQLDDLTHTPLPDDLPVHDLVSFRAAFLRAQMAKRDGERVSFGEVARLAGVRSRSAVARVLDDAGVGRLEQDHHEAKETRIIQPSTDVVKAINQHRSAVKGAPFAMQPLDLETGELGESMPYDPAQAEALVTKGQALRVTYRTAYTISLSPDAYRMRSEKPARPSKPTDPVLSERRTEQPEIGHYRASWVIGQCATLLRRLEAHGWRKGADYVNPTTGARCVVTSRDLGELLTVITGETVAVNTSTRAVDRVKRDTPLLNNRVDREGQPII